MISAAELKARVVVEGIPKGNKELLQFEGTLRKVSGYDATATLHADVDQTGFQTFEAEMRDASGRSASATLEAQMQGRGFDAYDARIAATKARTARPITQTVKADVDQRSFTTTLAEVKALKRKVDSEQGGGLAHNAAGIVAPFGMLPTAALAASPELLALAGAATAVAGSATEAALGVGALAVGGYGAAGVGIAGIASVAVPAVASLKNLTKVQQAYSLAVREYGKESTEAKTAAKKLQIAQAEAGPEAVKFTHALDSVESRWDKMTKPGQNAFFGALDDGLDHLEARMPLLARSADRSTKSMRHDFDLFLNQTTGKGSGFETFVNDMTHLFVKEGPVVTHILADWAKTFEHIAEAAGPSLEMVTAQISDFSDEVEHSSENGPKLRGEIEGLVDQTESWVKLLDKSVDFVKEVFGDSAGEGQSLVESATGKLEQWTGAMEANPEGVESFFEHAGEDTEDLLRVVGGLAQQWAVVSEAMEPVDHIVLNITEALDNLKIGNVSALTLLLGGGFAVGSLGKLAKTAEIIRGYGGIIGAVRAEETEQQAAMRVQEEGIASNERLIASNEALAASYQGVAGAQGEMAAAGEAAQAGQLSMLETGPVSAAEQAGQMSMFPMGSGVVPAAAPAAAEEAAAGGASASAFAGGMGMAMPAAVGAIGIGNIVSSVTHGDMRDAGWEAGGSLAGGITGFFVGGPAGAMIGAGVGSVLGEVVSGDLEGIFDGHHSQHHLEQVGEEQAQDFLRGYGKERPKIEREIHSGFLGHAGKEPHVVAGGGPSEYIPGFGTVQGSHALVGGVEGTGLRGRLQQVREQIHDDASPRATPALKAEEKALEQAISHTKRARATFADTIGQMDGDVSLGMGALNHDLATGLEKADAAWGKGTKPWRDHTAEAMEATVAAIKSGMDAGEINAEQGRKRINDLLARIHLVKGDDPFGLAQATARSFEKAGGITESGVQKWKHQLAQMPPAAAHSAIDSTNKLLQGWAEGHPKIEQQIEHLTAFEVKHFGVTNQQLREGVQKGATGPIAQAFHEAAAGVGGALDNIGVNTDRLLKALGSKDFVAFQAQVNYGGTTLGKDGSGARAAGDAKHHQLAGGGIVPGTASGDVHFTAVPEGSFILNKKATAAFGFAEGGMIPVALEPTERYFHPDEVAQIGLGNLMAMNAAVPRFAEGGAVSVGGPRATASAAGAAITMTAKAADAYVKAHAPKPDKGGGPMSLSGGLVATPLQFAEYMLRAGFPATVKVLTEGLGTILSESGFKVNNGQGPGGHIGPWAESPAFGSVKVREDPLGSTIAAYREWARDGHSFWQAWGQWEAEQSGLSGGGAGSYASQFTQDAEEALGQRGGRRPTRAATSAANAHHHRQFAEGGLVGFAAGGSVPTAPGLLARDLPDVAAPKAERDRFEALRAKGVLRFAAGGLIGDMLTRAKELKGTPYPQPDAHFGLQLHPAALDCSAAVSNVLWAAKLLDTEMASTALESWGSPGPGKNMTVYANSGHAWMELEGHPWGTSVGDAGAGGLGFHPQPGGDYKSEFVKRHSPAVEQETGHQTKAQEVAGTFKEKIPAVFHGAHTASLSLSGSAPNTMRAINAEIGRRKHELEIYTEAAAAAERADKPAVAHAIAQNVAALQKRLRELHDAKDALRRKEEGERKARRIKIAEKHVAARLGKQLGSLTGLEQGIEAAEHHYAKVSELAQQTVDLEPVAPEPAPEAAMPERPTFEKGTPKATREAAVKAWEQTTRDMTRAREVSTHQAEVADAEKLRSYIEGEEGPAYARVLDAEAGWRNRILGAEHKAAGDWANQKTVGGLEGGWEYDIESLVSQEHALEGREQVIERFADEVRHEAEQLQDDIRAFHQNHPGEPLNEHLQKRQDAVQDRQQKRQELTQQLPGLRAEVRGLEASERATRTTLGEGRALFFPGGARIKEPKPPTPGTGTFEGNLEEVQGIHWPDLHEYLPSLPATRAKGAFGGAIWETQGTIEELGLKAAAAMNGVQPLGPAEVYEEESEGSAGASQAQLERAELELGLVKEANQRLLIENALRPALEQFEASNPMAYMGAFAEGGVALVGEAGPELAHFPSGTRVHSATDTQTLMQPKLHVAVNGDIRQDPGDTRPPIEAWLEHPQNQKVIQKIALDAPRGLSRNGPGRGYRV